MSDAKSKATTTADLPPELRKVVNRCEETKEEGNTLYGNGKYELAIAAYSKAIEFITLPAVLKNTASKPELAERLADFWSVYYSNRGMAHNQAGNHQSVVDDCTVAIQRVLPGDQAGDREPVEAKSHPNRSLVLRALQRRAYAFEALGRHWKALQDWDTILTIDASSQIADAGKERGRLTNVVTKQVALEMEDAKNRGNNLFKESKFGDAAEAYSKCLDLSVRLQGRGSNKDVEKLATNALNNRALMYVRLGKFGEAKADCDRILTGAPQGLEAKTPGAAEWGKTYFRRGQALKGLGQLPAAVQDLQLALQLTPPDNASYKAISDELAAAKSS